VSGTYLLVDPAAKYYAPPKLRIKVLLEMVPAGGTPPPHVLDNSAWKPAQDYATTPINRAGAARHDEPDEDGHSAAQAGAGADGDVSSSATGHAESADKAGQQHTHSDEEEEAPFFRSPYSPPHTVQDPGAAPPIHGTTPSQTPTKATPAKTRTPLIASLSPAQTSHHSTAGTPPHHPRNVPHGSNSPAVGPSPQPHHPSQAQVCTSAPRHPCEDPSTSQAPPQQPQHQHSNITAPQHPHAAVLHELLHDPQASATAAAAVAAAGQEPQALLELARLQGVAGLEGMSQPDLAVVLRQQLQVRQGQAGSVPQACALPAASFLCC